jgi:hypothetical protein
LQAQRRTLRHRSRRRCSSSNRYHRPCEHPGPCTIVLARDYLGCMLGCCFSAKTVCLSWIVNAARRLQHLANDLPIPFQAILLRSAGRCGQAMRGESVVVAIWPEHNTWVVNVDTTKPTVQVLTGDLSRRRPVVPRIWVLDRFGRVIGWRRGGKDRGEERCEPQGESREAGFGGGHGG